ncbi:hypothetical protein SAMN05216334_11018 [Nitrosomonas ureae]|uniref:Uncharacterized protein n=1 Tax=Nitrosomonas ureae TaxID=44577 RepID=A0A1H5UY37_9PROT|nr:hypothetical protein SAMN05216334_11018 [Nitrosomonas ureae]
MKRSKLNSTAYLMTIIAHTSVLFLRWLLSRSLFLSFCHDSGNGAPLRPGTRVRRGFIGDRSAYYPQDRLCEFELSPT